MKYKIYDNQMRTANMVLNSINLGNKRIHVVAPTQSGKTGTIIHLANLMSSKNFLLSSGMMENHLFEQNSYIAENNTENIKAIKVHELLKEPNPKKVVKELSIDVVVFDESHYGIGQEGRLSKLIGQLSSSCPELVVVWVGATGYALINSDVIDDTIQMEVPKEYYGVSHILKSNNLIDSNSMKYIETIDKSVRDKSNVDYGVKITGEFKYLLNHLKGFSNGMGIIRVDKQETAQVIKEALNNSFPYAKVIVATSDTGIKSSVKDAKMIARKKRVVLIVVHGLKAGVDLGESKSLVRFVSETYKTKSSVCQGLVGRICGYHDNRSCIVVADREALELQSMYEADHLVINQKFLEDMLGVKSVPLSANIKYGSKYNTKKNYYYKGSSYELKSPSEVDINMFSGYNPKYYESVKSLMNKILEKEGDYKVSKEDHPSENDRINTIQSSKFKNRENFVNYIDRVKGDVNFSSIFHRFSESSEFRSDGKHKGGVSNGQYAKRIKVGLIYDNESKTFYLVVRGKRRVKRTLRTSINNKSIFNN